MFHLGHDPLSRPDDDVQFLAHLADEGVGLGFARLDAAARKTPLVRGANDGRPADQQETLGLAQHADDAVERIRG